MNSNFSQLINIAPGLYESISAAERLYVEEHYHFVPTAIRTYCEGIMFTVLDIDQNVRPLPSLKEMIEKFSCQFNKPHITSAADRIRKLGNKASHYKPHQWPRNDLNKAFQDAKHLYNFLIIDFHGIDIEPEVFRLEDIDNPLVIRNLEQKQRLRELVAQIEMNGKLVAKLEQSEKTNRELSQKVSLYASDYKSRQQELQKLLAKESGLKIELRTAVATEQTAIRSEVEDLQSQKQKLHHEVEFYERKLLELRDEEKTLLLQNQNFEYALLEGMSNSEAEVERRALPPLSDQQEQLVTIDSGKHFLEAPPGAGKTTILTHRLKYALDKFSDDRDIVCLTFTTRAAEEMQNRAKRVLKGRQPFIGNFHIFCLDAIRQSQRLSHKEKDFGILDDDYREVLLNLAKESRIDLSKEINPRFEAVALQGVDFMRVSSSKNFNRAFFSSYMLMLALEEIEDVEVLDVFSNLLKQNIAQLLSEATYAFDKERQDVDELVEYLWTVFLRFRELKKQTGTYDFDDILCIGLREIIANGEKKKYIQIDEVQDLSPMQWEIINAISDDTSHIFCVGDSYQSIYGFLGADLNKLQERTATYARHELTNNFRSDKNIVNLLSAYRQFNWNLPELRGTSEVDNKQSTLLLGYPDNHAENHNVIQMIEKILKDSNRRVGLLCSTNKLAEFYCDFLNSRKVNFFRVSKHDLMQRDEIQDWMSCLRAYQGNATNRDWWRLTYRFSKSLDKNINKSRCIQFINDLKAQGISVYDILQSGNLGNRIARDDGGDVLFNYNLKELVAKYDNEGVVIYDTETTGLDLESDKIVQIAAIKVVNGVIVDEFDRYIHLDFEADPALKAQFEESQKIHEIEISQVKNGQQLNHALMEFFSFVGECAVVAHNLTFDETMLKMNINSIENNYKALDAYHKFKQNVQMDSLQLARQHFPNQKNYKLENLLKDFELKGVNSHNALDDVKATASLLSYLIHTIKPKLSHIDSFLDRETILVRSLRLNWNNIERFMSVQTISGRSSLSSMLEEWLAFIADKKELYNNASLVDKEAREKLIPWLDKNGEYEGLLSNLVDDTNPSVAKLLTLKEVDLIDEKKHRLIVSTIHRAKGLEFETVIVPQVIGDSFPPWMPRTASEQERERHAKESQRLLYVALSRPRSKLIVTYHERKQPEGWPKYMSPYIEGIRDSFGFFRA
ncbi:UvrD-helicase domain-containing protein [Vibrio sp. B1Z05]|uniref:UvrD-helicase domain-containing protein n=1 Tax=Vibrio sp. B1Z05 TaxID=2654980 RepID=UPI00128CCDD6|nr:UvrD-helicase domain-containing protein [Vibrio sp. B1Z05]MPW37292.1 AAA family ATPase [Vibrio sp. B1Z05]